MTDLQDLHDFKPFPKTPRFNREYIITEKLDGTNCQIVIKRLAEDADPARYLNQPGFSVVAKDDGLYVLRAGSRKRWIAPNQQKMDGVVSNDHYGFAAWVATNANALANLGEGTHNGEWYGKSIRHGYGLTGRKFALFNTTRWGTGALPEGVPAELTVVPELARCRGHVLNETIRDCMRMLRAIGSVAESGAKAEGVIVFSVEAEQAYKVLLENDDIPKRAAA